MPLIPILLVGIVLLILIEKPNVTPQANPTNVIQEVENLILPIKNNNPGDLVYDTRNQWVGQTGKDPLSKFAQFDTPVNGSRACGINALDYFLDMAVINLYQFGDIWAPVSDNPGTTTGSYGQGLISYLNANYNMSLDESSPYDYQNHLPELIEAIAHNEGGLPAVIYFKDSFQTAGLEALQHKNLA